MDHPLLKAYVRGLSPPKSLCKKTCSKCGMSVGVPVINSFPEVERALAVHCIVTDVLDTRERVDAVDVMWNDWMDHVTKSSVRTASRQDR